MFTVFLIITIPPTVVNAVVPKFFTNMALWQAREHPSKIYGWIPFCTAQVVAEIPIAIVSAALYWVLWYWATGLPSESSVSGYVFLMTMLFFLFQASWGQWITAFAPSFTVISNVLPFFFVMFSLFNGVSSHYFGETLTTMLIRYTRWSARTARSQCFGNIGCITLTHRRIGE